MTNVIAISNQKGGVGKTTSAISIAYELSSLGFKTLLIDFDPQGSATSGTGVLLEDEQLDLFDMFFQKTTLSKIIVESKFKNLFVAPASRDLVGLEIELGKKPGRELILKTELSLLSSSFDFIIIDCPPSSGLLTLNALGAAQFVLVPLQAEYYALEGISALMNTISFVQQTFNPALSLIGVFMTMYDSRTNLSQLIEDEARRYFGENFIDKRISRNIKLSEAPSHGLPIGAYDSASTGARSYKELTSEIIHRINKLSEQEKVVANFS